MDEATSSLDAVSEDAITQAVRSLHGQITTIVIAHRLSTVVKADTIIYLQQGKIEAIGNFQQLRKSVPKFDLQAELMGISKSE
jgi:ABC-type multidrug transport system fused ATPase/permease subunit